MISNTAVFTPVILLTTLSITVVVFSTATLLTTLVGAADLADWGNGQREKRTVICGTCGEQCSQ